MGAASEQMIGKVGCNLATFNLVPACTASSYTTGQLIGTRMEIPNVDRLELGTVFLQDVVLNAKGAVSGAVDVIVFKANPTATTFTDHATYSLDTADVAKVAAVIHLLDQTSHGTPTTLQATQLA